MPNRLHERYSAEVAPALIKQFEYGNPMEVPRVDKIVVNIGLGEALTNAKAIDAAVGDLTTITGQRPIVTRAKRSIAQFHRPVSAIAPTSTLTKASGREPKCKIWVKIMKRIRAIKADSMNTSP